MRFEHLIERAEALLHEGQAGAALPIAEKALKERQSGGGALPDKSALPALNLLAEIYLQLGDPSEAVHYFKVAVAADPDGSARFDKASGGGVEKFLYLAQLSEEGGHDSLDWLEKGCAILRREIARHNSPDVTVLDGDEFLKELQASLAEALCAIVELYMTDLSFEEDAEERVERLISEALPLWEASESSDPTVLQTLASIRISQLRLSEAREILKASLELWNNDSQDEEGGLVPDFATRISLSRLLMEAGMEKEAFGVLERLVAEDDRSVEAWYLGGWCLYLLGQAEEAEDDAVDKKEQPNAKTKADEIATGDDDTMRMASLRASRKWLKQSLQLYEQMEYEDDRLNEHASELLQELNAILPQVDEEEDEEFEGFSDDELQTHNDEDEQMGEGRRAAYGRGIAC